MDFPGGKVSAYSAGDLGSFPGLGRSPGEGNGYPLQCSWNSGEFHGKRSLMSYSPLARRVRHSSVIFTFFFFGFYLFIF